MDLTLETKIFDEFFLPIQHKISRFFKENAKRKNLMKVEKTDKSQYNRPGLNKS